MRAALIGAEGALPGLGLRRVVVSAIVSRAYEHGASQGRPGLRPVGGKDDAVDLLERDVVSRIAGEVLDGGVLTRVLLLRAAVELAVSDDVFLQIAQSLLQVLQRSLAGYLARLVHSIVAARAGVACRLLRDLL